MRPCRQARAVGYWSLQIAVAVILRVAARPLPARSRSPARSCWSNSSSSPTSRRSTASSQRAHTPAGLQRRLQSRPQMSVPAASLLEVHLISAHPFVAGLLLAAHRGGLPHGGQTGQVVPCTSGSSGEILAMHRPVEQNAEPGLARPSTERGRLSANPLFRGCQHRSLLVSRILFRRDQLLVVGW